MEFPLSFEQERLWLLDQVRSGAPEYLLRWRFRLRGPVDRVALAAAVTELADRHEVLRTHYESVDGQPVQVVDEPAPVGVAAVDPGDEPLDLRRAPWRVTLAQAGPDETILTITVHHIAFDNSSLGILARELRQLYTARLTGEPADLPALPVQYADFAKWQRERWDTPS
jgi:Condensation domain